MDKLRPLVISWVIAWTAAIGLGAVVLLILGFFGFLTREVAWAVMGVSAAAAVAAAAAVTYLYAGMERPKEGRGGIFRYVILGIAPMAVLVVGVVVATQSRNAETSIAILLITGVVALLFMLAVTAVFFHGLALNDVREALGLPKGSIRAVIALALILVFAIMSVYLFTAFDGDPEAQEQMALQLITALTTLVVAIASFYFGSNAVQTATESLIATRGGRTLRVSGPSPLPVLKNTEGKWGPAVTFTVTTQPLGLEVNVTVYGDKSETITATGSSITYIPSTPGEKVLLIFALAEDSSVSERIELSRDDQPSVTAPAGGTTPPDSGAPDNSSEGDVELAGGAPNAPAAAEGPASDTPDVAAAPAGQVRVRGRARTARGSSDIGPL